MGTLSLDQSSSFRCKIHGHRASAYFIRPSAGESFSAFYTCTHCAKDAGVKFQGGLNTPISMEQIELLPKR